MKPHPNANATPSRAQERPVAVPPALSAVRSVVRHWQQRTLRVQPTGELARAAAVLSAHEADLARYSAHAPRLLAALRHELSQRP